MKGNTLSHVVLFYTTFAFTASSLSTEVTPKHKLKSWKSWKIEKVEKVGKSWKIEKIEKFEKIEKVEKKV